MSESQGHPEDEERQAKACLLFAGQRKDGAGGIAAQAQQVDDGGHAVALFQDGADIRSLGRGSGGGDGGQRPVEERE